MHEQVTFKTELGVIHCDGCERRIGAALAPVPGISAVHASAKTQEIRVRLDPAQFSVEQVEAKLAAIGFPVRRA